MLILYSKLIISSDNIIYLLEIQKNWVYFSRPITLYLTQSIVFLITRTEWLLNSKFLINCHQNHKICLKYPILNENRLPFNSQLYMLSDYQQLSISGINTAINDFFNFVIIMSNSPHNSLPTYCRLIPVFLRMTDLRRWLYSVRQVRSLFLPIDEWTAIIYTKIKHWATLEVKKHDSIVFKTVPAWILLLSIIQKIELDIVGYLY